MNRKSWIDAAITDKMNVSDTHQLAFLDPRPDENIDIQDIMEFNKSCHEWPVDAVWLELSQRVGEGECLIIITEGPTVNEHKELDWVTSC